MLAYTLQVQTELSLLETQVEGWLTKEQGLCRAAGSMGVSSSMLSQAEGQPRAPGGRADGSSVEYVPPPQPSSATSSSFTSIDAALGLGGDPDLARLLGMLGASFDQMAMLLQKKEAEESLEFREPLKVRAYTYRPLLAALNHRRTCRCFHFHPRRSHGDLSSSLPFACSLIVFPSVSLCFCFDLCRTRIARHRRSRCVHLQPASIALVVLVHTHTRFRSPLRRILMLPLFCSHCLFPLPPHQSMLRRRASCLSEYHQLLSAVDGARAKLITAQGTPGKEGRITELEQAVGNAESAANAKQHELAQMTAATRLEFQRSQQEKNAALSQIVRTFIRLQLDHSNKVSQVWQSVLNVALDESS